MVFEQIRLGQGANFAYLFADREDGTGFAVDPAFELEPLLRQLAAHRVTLARIVLTHHHSDHVNRAEELRVRTGAAIYAHEATGRLLKGRPALDGTLADGEVFTVGAGLEAHVLVTPGHAPGGLCLVVADRWLVTGDALFVGDCGRTDLAGGDTRQLFESLQRLKRLPGHLLVCPGHDYGPAPTRPLAEELRLNPALLAPNVEAFAVLP